MRKEEIIKCYMEENYNCAETILKAANTEYDLKIHEDDIKLVSGFGGGMGVGSTCGALSGAIAVLGKVFVETKDHETENFRDICGEFFERFKEELGASDCVKLKEMYKKEDGTKCLATIEKASKVLEDFLREKGKGIKEGADC